jgi:hypothetical protein
MPDVRYHGKSPEQRITDRLKNSGGDLPADVRTKQGEGPQRVFHNIHHNASEQGLKRRNDNGGSDAA